MLSTLHIRDFAIIGELLLELDAGFSVFTGETGAGKSIIVEALGLILGGRGGADVVRHGAERAVITAAFDIGTHPELCAWLTTQGIENDRECVLQRQIGRDGRSRALVNGTPVAIGTLAQCAEQLIDIHGQHAHQLLLRAARQRACVDEFGGYADLLAETARIADAWQRARTELEALGSVATDPGVELDRLRHELREFETLALAPEALTDLEREHKRAANLSRLLEATRAALETLADGESAIEDRLGALQRDLDHAAALDPDLGAASALLADAGIAISEATASLRRYLDALDLDPSTLARLEARLEVLHDLARKHRVAVRELASVRDRHRDRIATIEGAADRVAALNREIADHLERYRAIATRLHEARKRAGDKLAKAVAEALGSLGMAGARLAVGVETDPQAAPARQGGDRVEFQFSANPGQPLRPLAKVASGGELSRVSLALQMATRAATEVPTLVFDEVDSGIGGAVAETVGRELRRLGGTRQVLCVTHLPQVASQAHRHWLVEKDSDAQSTRTRVRALASVEREREIARMLGGVTITARTLAHAREMLANG